MDSGDVVQRVLSALEEEVREISSRTVRIEETLRVVSERQENLDRIVVRGNGLVPHQTQLVQLHDACERIEESIKGLEEDRKERRDHALKRQGVQWQMWAVIVAMMGSMGAVAVALLK